MYAKKVGPPVFLILDIQCHIFFPPENLCPSLYLIELEVITNINDAGYENERKLSSIFLSVVKLVPTTPPPSI